LVVAVNEPSVLITTFNPEGPAIGVIVAVSTLNGYPAASLAIASTPGRLMIILVATVAEKLLSGSVIPVAPSIGADPKVTVVQSWPLVAPLPQ
jgi:hypothetical protein